MDTYAILVGWEHADCAGNFDLRLQTRLSSGHLAQREVETFHILMTPQQAAILGNYLFQITGQTPPEKPKGRLRRWFG
ncbi:MAG: hypothetical protein ABIW31_06325 [Novosphingobium sp.]